MKTNNANDANRAKDRRAVGVAEAVGVVEDGTAGPMGASFVIR